MRPHRVVLEHHAHAACLGRHHRVGRRHQPAVDLDRAGVGRDVAGDQPQRRGLAAAARAEQRDELVVARCRGRDRSTAAHVGSPAPKLFDSRVMVIAGHADPQLGRRVGARDASAAEPVGEPDRDADDHHVDHGERRHRLDVAGLVEVVDRDRERDRARARTAGSRRTAPGSPARTPGASRRTGPGRISGSVISRMVVRPGGAEDVRALLERGIDLPQRRIGGAHAERNVAADIGEQQDGQRAVERDRHREPELDQRHRHHDAGQAERNERGVVEQLAAGNAGAQVDPADHGAEHHRDGGGGDRQHQAVDDRALGDVVVEQDELVVGAASGPSRIRAPRTWRATPRSASHRARRSRR